MYNLQNIWFEFLKNVPKVIRRYIKKKYQHQEQLAFDFNAPQLCCGVLYSLDDQFLIPEFSEKSNLYSMEGQGQA